MGKIKEKLKSNLCSLKTIDNKLCSIYKAILCFLIAVFFSFAWIGESYAATIGQDTTWTFSNGKIIGKSWLDQTDADETIQMREDWGNSTFGIFTVNSDGSLNKTRVGIIPEDVYVANNRTPNNYLPNPYSITDKYGIKYTLQTTSHKGRFGIYLSSYRLVTTIAGSANITVEIPHGIALDSSYFKRTAIFFGAGRSGNTYNGTLGDIAWMVSHIQTCQGGSWQADSSGHWRAACSTCGYSTSKVAHNMVQTKAPTCTVNGTKQCSVCGYTATIPALGHSWSTAWSSNASQHYHKCVRCDATNGAANHTWTTVKAATCTEKGSKKCTVCGYTATIPALGHAYESTWSSDGTTHYHKCSRCGDKKDVANHTWTYSNINATTHDKQCTICKYKVTSEKHNFVNNVCACGRHNVVTVHFDLNKPSPEGGLLADTNPSSINDIVYLYEGRYFDTKYGLKTPTLQDYEFLGWYTAKTGGTKLDASTTVTNVQTHTIYAHWKAIEIPIKQLKGSDIRIIESNGETETQYRKNHTPDASIPYSSAKYTMSADGSFSSSYKYTWEMQKSDGSWTNLSLAGVSTDKGTITFKNVTRAINQTKIRLTIRNNAGSKITSNEMKIVIFYLPNTKLASTMTGRLGFDPVKNPNNTNSYGDPIWATHNSIITEKKYSASDKSLTLKWKTKYSDYVDRAGVYINFPRTTDYTAKKGDKYSLYVRFKYPKAGAKIRMGLEALHTEKIKTTGGWQEFRWSGSSQSAYVHGDGLIHNAFVFFVMDTPDGEEYSIQISDLEVTKLN